MDLNLLQKQVAEQIGVNKDTVYNWERQRTVPEIRFMPRIIQFLGYDPTEQSGLFADQLKGRRIALGLAQRKLAKKLGIDPGTIGSWERGHHRPTKEHQEILDKLIGRGK